jgi:hypothetical protein
LLFFNNHWGLNGTGWGSWIGLDGAGQRSWSMESLVGVRGRLVLPLDFLVEAEGAGSASILPALDFRALVWMARWWMSSKRGYWK